MSVEQIIEEAGKLPLDEQRAIVENLTANFHEDDWSYSVSREELRSQLDEVLAQKADLVPAEEVMARLEKKYCRGKN